MDMTLKVDIWSDIACPWCYIGKRRFERALEGFDGEVEIEYHSFELAPDTPVDFDGSEIDFLVKHKGMPEAQVTQMLGQIRELAAGEGLSYDFDSLQHTKTGKAHELLHYAKAHGKQGAMKERLLKAYFEQGRHVGRVADLVALATDIGLDAEETAAALESGRYVSDVEDDLKQAAEYGINGVPFFVFDGRLAVSGAQSPDVFAQALKQASS